MSQKSLHIKIEDIKRTPLPSQFLALLHLFVLVRVKTFILLATNWQRFSFKKENDDTTHRLQKTNFLRSEVMPCILFLICLPRVDYFWFNGAIRLSPNCSSSVIIYSLDRSWTSRSISPSISALFCSFAPAFVSVLIVQKQITLKFYMQTSYKIKQRFILYTVLVLCAILNFTLYVIHGVECFIFKAWQP